MKLFFSVVLFFFYINLSLAHHKIYSPRVHDGEFAIEWRRHFTTDSRTKKNKLHHHVLEAEYSWTSFWQSEIEFHLRQADNNNFRWFQTEFQNQFQIIDRETWAAALYFSYNWLREKGEADQIEYKVLLEKDLFGYKNIGNIIFENEFGSKAKGSTEFKTSFMSMRMKPIYKDIKIGIGGMSNFGQLDNFNSPGRQKHQYGIAFKKPFKLFNGLEYDILIGNLRGLTNASPDNTFIWNMEIEY